MKPVSRRIAFVVAYITIAGGLWTASQWWEKALATSLSDPVISPGGCYRVETFKPLWVLPSMLQPEYDPNEDKSPRWFQLWGYPGFYRLFLLVSPHTLPSRERIKALTPHRKADKPPAGTG
jgi:hypothetical protein